MKIGLKEGLAVSAPYGFVVVVLYLKGFWDTFDVNALQFVALSDIVGAAIFPMVAFLLIMPVAWLLGSVVGKWLRSLHKPISPEAQGQERAGLPVNVRNGQRLAIAAAISLPVAYLLIPAPNKWAVTALLAATVFAPTINNGDFRRLVPSESVRLVMLLLAVAMPILVYYRGAIDARRSLEPGRARTIDTSRSVIPVVVRKATYLGLLGDTHFVWDVDRKTVLLLPKSDELVIAFSPVASPNPILRLPKLGVDEPAEPVGPSRH